ncbi:Ribosomal protein L34Ae [Corchorus capsularis]|uniref:Ribosomal protein L34Ae n=1 Tax=Corchorus capsularis TaxID=210143 RepID=A0A1R3I0E4_COCAP|nr:Ribosomal protein L34Ae [Corchorus capsularis]
MDFLKVKKFRKAQKPEPGKDLEDKPVPQPEEPKNENGVTEGVGGGDNNLSKSSKADPAAEVEDDDDDFITNEVKRRLKELRRNSFMVLIPEEEEETYPEEEEEEEAGETSSNEWRDVEAEGRQWWGGFDAVYEKYCERMLFFDRMIAQQLKEAGSTNFSTPSPKSASKKLSSPLRCLSLKKIEEPDEETENLQLPINDPYQDIETAYVAQICLTWEALHCQYSQLSQIVLCQPENPTCYNHSAQHLQQFQVLLQRFIENEPFQDGLRAEIYSRARNILPKLLQIPNIQGSEQKEKVEEESDYLVHAPDIIRLIESSILTFQLFVKADKKKHSSVLNLFGNQNLMATPLQQVQSLLEKIYVVDIV